MSHYPLATLMLAWITDTVLISTPQDLPKFEEFLGDGRQRGVTHPCAEASAPDGIAQAFLLGDDLVAPDPVALILDHNIF